MCICLFIIIKLPVMTAKIIQPTDFPSIVRGGLELILHVLESDYNMESTSTLS